MNQTDALTNLASLCSYAAGTYCQDSIRRCLADHQAYSYCLGWTKEFQASHHSESHPGTKPSEANFKFDGYESSTAKLTTVEDSIQHSPRDHADPIRTLGRLKKINTH